MNNSDNFELHPQLANDSYILGDLPLSRLLLINDCQYPWFVLIPRKNNIREIYQLSNDEQAVFWYESAELSQSIMDLYQGDKLNVAALGNMVPQLHIHHIVRFKSDLAWPGPVWGKVPMKAYRFDEIITVQEKIAERLTRFVSSELTKKS